METYILLTGLLFLNAIRDPTTHEVTQLDVYVLDSSGKTTPWLTPLDDHHPEVRDYERNTRSTLSGDVAIEGPAGVLRIQQQDRFLDIPRFFERSVYRQEGYATELTLRPECTSSWSTAQLACLAQGKPLLAARIHIRGDWEVLPYEVNFLERPIPLLNQTWLGMVLPRANSPLPEFLPDDRAYFQLASSVLLRKRIDAAPAARFLQAGESLAFPLVPAQLCLAWFKTPGTCRLIVFSNHLHSEGTTSASSQGGLLLEEIEEHFVLNYELFAAPPTHRLTPVMRRRDTAFYSAIEDTRPGSRGPTWICPGTAGAGLWQ